MRRTVIITTGRHPFQVAITATCLLSSIVILVTGSYPPSFVRGMPPGFVNIWLYVLSVDAVLTLMGIYWRGKLTSALLIEAGGVIGIAATTAVYSVVMATFSGLNALGAGGFITGISIACWWRAVQCVLDSRRLDRAENQRVTHTRVLLVEPGPADNGERP
jgi:hypothetical protein